MIEVVDDALRSAAEARKGKSEDAEAKFKEAIDALSAYERKHYSMDTVTRTMEDAKTEDKSSSKILNRLKEKFQVREGLACLLRRILILIPSR